MDPATKPGGADSSSRGPGLLFHFGLLVLVLSSTSLLRGPSRPRGRRPDEPVPFARALWFFLFLFWPALIMIPVLLIRA